MATSAKTKVVRAIDAPAAIQVGGVAAVASTADTLAPAGPIPPPPYALTVTSSGILASDVTVTAIVTLRWRSPAGVNPTGYEVQWATDSAFASIVATKGGDLSGTARIDTLATGTLYYFRVRARVGAVVSAWSASASVTTAVDTTPPAAPTGATFSWDSTTGTLLLLWTNPTSKNFRDVRVRIYTSNPGTGGTLLSTYYTAGTAYAWTIDQQRRDRGGSLTLPAAASCYVILNARSYGTALSTDVVVSPSISAPAAPSGLAQTWSGDTGAAGADLTVSWTLGAVAGYRLTLDGTARDVGLTTRYTYTLAANAAEHAGTPDPVVSVSLVALDALGQTSTASTATATNAAPAATTATASGNVSTFTLVIAASSAADLQDYRVRSYLNGSGTPTDTFFTTATLATYEPLTSGSWRFDVSVRDAFGQISTASALTTAATTISMIDFVTNLRASVVYADSVGTAAATLAGLKDDNLTTDVVTYALSASAWRWTEANRQQIDRVRTVTLATSASSSYYLGTSQDGVTYTWYAGGTATGGVWSPVAQASEAAAQTAATTLAAGTWRIDLPATVLAQYVRLGHRNTGASYALRELYPRALIQADDIGAQAITAEKIAVGTITGDRIVAGTITATLISVTNLSAISANLGTITAGTMTGATIQTAASGSRAVLDSTGLTTYDSTGTVQVTATTSTNGTLKAGAGTISIDKNGIAIDDTSVTGVQRINWTVGGALGPVVGTAPAIRYALTYSGGVEMATTSGSVAGTPAAYGGTGVLVYSSAVYVGGSGGLNVHGGALTVGTSAAPKGATITAGINVGTATGAATGEIRASSQIYSYNSTNDLTLRLYTAGTTNQLASTDGAFSAYKGLYIGCSALSFFTTSTPVAKPTVTGSRGGNAALASLLTSLASLGLLTDSSTA